MGHVCTVATWIFKSLLWYYINDDNIVVVIMFQSLQQPHGLMTHWKIIVIEHAGTCVYPPLLCVLWVCVYVFRYIYTHRYIYIYIYTYAPFQYNIHSTCHGNLCTLPITSFLNDMNRTGMNVKNQTVNSSWRICINFKCVGIKPFLLNLVDFFLKWPYGHMLTT